MNGKPRDVLERVMRQLLQTYGPTLAVVLSSATAASGDWRATAVVLVSVVIGTTLKALSTLKSQPGDPLWKVILDRAGSAFGMQLAGLGVADLTDLIALDWGKAFGAAAAAAALALTMYYLTPPSNAPSPAPAEPVGPAPTDPTGPGGPIPPEGGLGADGTLDTLYGSRGMPPRENPPTVYDQDNPYGR